MRTYALFVLCGILGLLSLTSGCACLIPDTAAIEAGHISHASQHFGAHPTNYGYDTAEFVLRWHGDNAYAEVSEGVTLDNALDGYREVFQARVGYAIPLK